MRLFLLAALLASAAPAAVHAHEEPAPAAQSKPVPKDELLKPPADAAHYVVVSESGKHGDQWRWQLADGRTAYRWSQELRGWITEGQVPRLQDNPVARHFTEGQRIQMPGYGDRLNEDELKAVMAYVRWVNEGEWQATGMSLGH